MTWSNTATIEFTTEDTAVVSGVGPQLAVVPVTITLDVRFVHDDPAYPDVFFTDTEDAEAYRQFNPGTVQHATTRMTQHAVLWALPGLVARYYRNLDDVIRHSRALSGNPGLS